MSTVVKQSVTPEVIALAMAGKHIRQTIDEWYDLADKRRQADQAWRDKTVKLAQQLFAAKQEHKATNLFGQWCDTYCSRLSDNDRAALIHLGEYIEETKLALEQTDRRSVRLLWEEVVRPVVEPKVLPKAGSEDDEPGEDDEDEDAPTPDDLYDFPEPAPKSEPRSKPHKVPHFPSVVKVVNDYFSYLILKGDTEAVKDKLHKLVNKVLSGTVLTFPSGYGAEAHAKKEVAAFFGAKTYDQIPAANRQLAEKLLKDHLTDPAVLTMENSK